MTISPAGTSEANIEAALTNIAGSTYTSNPTGGQFSTNRNAVLFMPGTYTVRQAPIGYYTSIAGLGQNPGDVVINGFITPNFGAWVNLVYSQLPSSQSRYIFLAFDGEHDHQRGRRCESRRQR